MNLPTFTNVTTHVQPFADVQVRGAHDFELAGHEVARAYAVTDTYGRTLGHVCKAAYEGGSFTWFAVTIEGKCSSHVLTARHDAIEVLRVLRWAELLSHTPEREG